ncbi:hypothetical protein SDRG_13012 [Saprolegnia diclina VS20]|uniref:Uncharacterized protein n=1 Tax=Saprolegnia diclina (strain VS20) TaxID=1156394 RepID=T0RAX5_SAPDV|nr:hypothetical protein SDRG_13012 [Saprolegnia diclina VS20]EQC29343.1 hypothetical protein SDRG_13012 [Saprolegnia diclina VS20]|eukprot:XP_008617317.1 hypothetical protein SDRG_13012 [Saprolegnia diclina VS20]
MTESGYRSTLGILRLSSSKAADYFEAIDPTVWALHPHLHTMALHGWRTSNFVESYNSEALPARNQDPFNFFVSQMDDMMTTAYTHRMLAAKWSRDKRAVTPYASSLIQVQADQAPRYKVLQSSSTIVYVKAAGASAASKRRVDMAAPVAKMVLLD